MFINHIIEKFAHFNLTEHELAETRKILRVEHYRRNSLFLKKQESSNRIGLLLKGLMYAYSVGEDDEENVQGFFYPSSAQDVVFNYESYILNSPSEVAYKCYQDSTLIVLDTDKVKELYDKFPRFYQLEMLIMQPHFLQALLRTKILQAGSAIDKIKALKSQSPELFKLFPSAYIASYLGIHRNTFNRAMTKI